MREGGRDGGGGATRKCSFRQKEIKAPMIPQGGKVSGREMKWKTATNWKSGTGVEGGDVEAVKQGDSSLKGWR